MHKITLFTSNNIRHNYLINFLSRMTKSLYVIQESKTIFPGLNSEISNNKVIHEYFKKVDWAQKKIFQNNPIKVKKNVKLLPLKMGDLRYLKIRDSIEFFKSDIYIVFGSSLIKGEILKFLKRKKAINIHMGISPYYRGADCNFWAQNDGNSNLVGATIHYLSDGIDDGKIISHATSEFHHNRFLHSMSTVKSAFYCLKKVIHKNKKISFKQDLNQTIKLSKKKDFNPTSIKKFFYKKYKKQKENFKLIDCFILKRKNYFLNE